MFSSVLHAIIVGSHVPAVMALSLSTTTMVDISSPASCATSINACFEDSTCLSCLSVWDTDSSLSECEGRYSSIAEADSCVELGVSSCCSIGNEAMIDSCMNNEVFVQYWGCYMNESSCAIEDMPCYPTPAIASPSLFPIPAPMAPPLHDHPTLKPPASNHSTSPRTATASLSSVLGDLTAERDLASSSTTDTIDAQCTNQSSVCLDDDVCQGCMPDVTILVSESWSQDDFSECETDFLGTTSDAGICEVAGAMLCCSIEGECEANDSLWDNWTCIFEALECSMVDVTCMGGIGGSYRSDDDFSLTDDDGVINAEDSGSSHASRRLLAPRNQPHMLFAVLLVGIAVAARPSYDTVSV